MATKKFIMSVTLCERFNGTSQHCCDEIHKSKETANIQIPEIEDFIYISYEIAITTHTHLFAFRCQWLKKTVAEQQQTFVIYTNISK